MANLTTAIFDMDGLMIDSEPYWQEAGVETLGRFNVSLTEEEYHQSLGLRTEEWLDYWFTSFQIDRRHLGAAQEEILGKAIEKIKLHAKPLEGIHEILKFFKDRKFKIGLATSSPFALIDIVLEKLDIREFFEALSSAETLPYSKPHPEVYLNCALQLGSTPISCICFEDSYNGMISAKSARMKCVVVPDPTHFQNPKWAAADLKIGSLKEFDERSLKALI